MQLANTDVTYGTITKTFHWLIALLILTNIPLAWLGENLPDQTSQDIARLSVIWSTHKTIGVAVFFVALLRILWALTQPKPAPVHPDRRAETLLAETIHWCLYAALVVVPLSGWIGHAASQGYAPIWWPFGQSLPLVPRSDAVEEAAKLTHWLFTWILIVSLGLHIAGALKHALIDRDSTLSRMWFGRADLGRIAPAEHPGAAMLLAATIYVFGGVSVLALAYEPVEAPEVAEAAPAAATGGNWQVESGDIGITVQQMGSAIQGGFADWTAEIDFTEEVQDGTHGTVTVEIDIPSLTLGSVTSQALGPDYFAANDHPVAVYEATILPAEDGYLAEGTLSLAGQESQVDLPFTLTIDGDTATMNGTTTLDRRNFGIGDNQTDPSTLGFTVDVDIAVTATRAD
ncbi:cytochrome b/b6 domain-containing protein [Palleronia pelagia]|uniref:Cytochrome b561 n=1 Tax=Palleronia pelagia TaxID=387096 RepID=A0A1H8I6X4_9RHOB|nr:cytochrome b/b6 domain-containing protein [Palleronia pelagia]SEN63917.1 Cytochrome b561 [Palleronia pelagia]